MGNKTIIWYKIVLVFGIVHTIRDILQIFDVKNILTETLVWKHYWCGAYCDYVAFPVEIFVMVASIIILKRKRSGILGKMIILGLIIFLLMWFWK